MSSYIRPHYENNPKCDTLSAKFSEENPPKKGKQVESRKGKQSLPPTEAEIPEESGERQSRYLLKREKVAFARLVFLLQALIIFMG